VIDSEYETSTELALTIKVSNHGDLNVGKILFALPYIMSSPRWFNISISVPSSFIIQGLKTLKLCGFVFAH
jgi:hypothetical protein